MRKQLRRAQILAFFSRLPPCLVGLEACATAHYWARELLAALGGAAAAWPGAALAQTPGRLWKIGVLANEPWPPLEGLRDGLRDLCYIEGKTHFFVYRFAQGHAERFPALASELVNLPVDVIVSWGTPASLAAHKSTDTIPIVMLSLIHI